MGEGAGAFILESRRYAEARGANILARVLGFGRSFAHVPGRHCAGVDGIRRAIQGSLTSAGLAAADIGHVNAHGSGMIEEDRFESQAIRASRANARANGVVATFATPAALPPAAPFDVLVANILANPLVVLAPALAARVRAGGRIVLSGILAPQAATVAAAYAPWFTISIRDGDDGWVALAGVRDDDGAAAR